MVKIKGHFDWLILMAAEGYRECKTDLLQATLMSVKTAKFDNQEAQKFLISALKEILKGEDANKAFLQNRKRGKEPDFAIAKRQYEMAQAVYFKMQKRIPGKTKNRSKMPPLNQCIEEVCADFKAEFETVQKAYYKNRKIIEEDHIWRNKNLGN